MLKTVGSSGQLTLGKKYSGRHFEVEELAGGELVLHPVRLVRDAVASEPAKRARAGVPDRRGGASGDAHA